MKTTNLFIELLVIGVGAVSCMAMVVYLLIGYGPFEYIPFNSTVLLFPITAFTYVSGIVFDRIFDILTEKWDKSIRKEHLTEEEYKDVRTILYNDSKMVQEVFDYTKNRIRIVRSWMFYFAILAVLVLVQTVFKGGINGFFLVFMLLMLCVFSVIAFRKLTHSFYGLLSTARVSRALP